MSTQYLFLIILFINATCGITRPRRDLTFGKRLKGDKLAMKIELKQSSKLLQSVWKTKTYNTEGAITYIRIFDNTKNGSGARIIVKNGGVGTKFLTINFRSRKGVSLNFTIEIYHIIKETKGSDLTKVENEEKKPSEENEEKKPSEENAEE